MKESELKEMIDSGVDKLLKSKEFEHIYKHLVAKSKESVMDNLKDYTQDDLNDHANDGVHHEQMDQYHSSTSVSIDMDTVLEMAEVYKQDLESLEVLYSKILDNN